MNLGDTNQLDTKVVFREAILKRAFDEAFDLEARIALDARFRTDQEDIGNEMAGRGALRLKRFLPDNGDRMGDGGKDGKRRRDFVSELQFLLQTDAAYRELYTTAQRKITEAEQATETALDMVKRLIAEANDAIKLAESQTQHIDGEPVFKDSHGRVWTADGERVPENVAAGIEWRGNEMTREDYLQLREVRDGLIQERDDILLYQTDMLGRARDRFSDESTPPKPDEIHDLMDGIETKMPEAVAYHLEASAKPSVGLTSTTGITVPALK